LSATARRRVSLGVLLVSGTLALSCVAACEATSDERMPGDLAEGISANVETKESVSEPHHDHNPLNATSIRVGVCFGAALFAALWIVGFRRSPIRLFPGLIVALYVALAFGTARDFFPVSRFDMYSLLTSQNQHDPSRLVVQDKSGELHPVQSYSRWSCDARIEPLLDGCHERFGPFYYIPYIDKEDMAHMDRAGPPTQEIQEVELVRAVWRLSGTASGIQRVDICPLVKCRVGVGP
jgi:hypothetical protein